MWIPDEELVRAARGHLADEAADLLAGVAAPAHDLAYLEALGTIVAAGAANGPDFEPAAAVRAVVESRLKGLELPALDDAHADFLESAPRCLTLDETEWEEELRPLLRALACRDRVELAWLGARALGMESIISADAQASRLAFDGMLEDVLWQLLPLNSRRRSELAWIEPARRASFPWWSLGVELPEDALVNPEASEKVLELFPAAAGWMKVARGVMPKPRARVLSLVERLKQPRSSLDGRGRAAAAAGETPLLDDPDVELSLREPALLVVDVLSPLRPGQLPALLLGTERRVVQAVRGDGVERYCFDLSLVGAGSAVLSLPLEAGTREVPIG